MATAKKEVTEVVAIKPPKFERAVFKIKGVSPFVQSRFANRGDVMDKMAQGNTAKGKKDRKPRDFEEDYKRAMYISEQGWNGFHAASFRNAMISACRLVGFRMTLAKLSVFIEADGFSKEEGTPLVKIIGKPERMDAAVRNATGVMDIRSRPMWREWSAQVRVRFDADQFTLQDVTNLMSRVGMQVGIGEGRPDSRESAGMGWGLFEIVN